MRALECARREMEQLTVESLIIRALRSKITPASRYVINPGDLVTGYREEAKRCIGPVEVTKVDRKIVHVHDGIKSKLFSIVQIMPAQTGNTTIGNDLDRIYELIDEAP